MTDEYLLKMLRCPETRQELDLVEGAIIGKINAAIKECHLKNRGGDAIQGPIKAGLLRRDRCYLYPIMAGVPIMLIDEAIPFAAFDS
jgi:uncharacterized protein YbaR (Trm112 family)